MIHSTFKTNWVQNYTFESKYNFFIITGWNSLFYVLENAETNNIPLNTIGKNNIIHMGRLRCASMYSRYLQIQRNSRQYSEASGK